MEELILQPFRGSFLRKAVQLKKYFHLREEELGGSSLNLRGYFEEFVQVKNLCFNAGVSFRTITIVYYAFVFGQGMLFTFTIFPEDLPDDTEEDVGRYENGSKTEKYIEHIKSDNAFTISREVQQNDTESMEDKKHDKIEALEESPTTGTTSLFSMIKSPKFIIHTCFVSISVLRSTSIIGMINPLLKRLTDDEGKGDRFISHHIWNNSILWIIFVFCSWFFLDWAPAGRHRDFSVILSFILTGVLSILVTVGLLIPVLEFQIVVFLLYTVLRSFLYSTHGSFIMKAFPLYHAGALFGLSLLVSAVVSLFQIPMFALMEGPYGGDPTWVNVGLLVVQMVVMVHPMYLWICAENEKKGNNHNTSLTISNPFADPDNFSQAKTKP
ncbi:solute carrier family 43 member 3-like [Dendronephthya gigantea]|uniref:solute carrier family 43 member 3-like n=1 Tax=Dendronephthya gigantea TaxID=151771 RepID=UPI00106C53B1|nr:solute carrier family 43 member 3-like [Dendronephthya gigantea]